MDILKRKAAAYGADLVDLTTVQFTTQLLRCIPKEVVRKYGVLPIAESGHCLIVAVANPSDLDAVDGLRLELGRELELHVAEKSQLYSFIDSLFGDRTNL